MNEWIKIYCICGKHVADIKEGSMIRKESIMICKECRDKYLKIDHSDFDEVSKLSKDKDTKIFYPKTVNEFGDILSSIFSSHKTGI
jgi:hypothetical protein